MKCSRCGTRIPDKSRFCGECGFPVMPEGKRENVVTGCVGACLGALIGAGCIILLSQLGYIAAVSGLILAVCTLKGYELLGGKLSGKGIVISLLLMAAAPYLADRINWAILIMQEWKKYGVTFGEAFGLLPELLETGALDQNDYATNLLMLYIFTGLGGFSIIRGAITD